MPPIDRLSALDSAFLDLDSAQAPLHVGWTILVEGHAPSLSALLRRAGAGVQRAARAARASAATVSHGGDLPGAVRQLAAPAPATALDRSATHRRVMGLGITSLEGAREAGRRHGATINDVLLAAATLALGRALRRRGSGRPR